LDPSDEERNVKRAENEVARAEAALRQARLQLESRRTSAIEHLEAQIRGLDAQLVDARFDLEEIKRLLAQDIGSNKELINLQARHDQLAAQLDVLRAERAQADIAIQLAEQDVVLAEKALENAVTALSDARERHAETQIRAPIDGMITVINVEVGEVVQGGRTTITGGTVLAVVADISEIIVRTEVADADIGAVLWLAPVEARPGGESLAGELQAGDVAIMTDSNGLAERVMVEGTPVKIHVDAFRDEDFEGVIERIYPEPRTIQNIVTYLVDIRVTSPNWRKLALVLGMQADVEFTAQAVKDALLVPHDAIRTGPSGGLGVYVPFKAEGQTEARPQFVPCRFGLDNGLYAELISGEGIEEGTEVYIDLPARFESGEDEEEDE
jgi:HlyD family secretion protein